jgi:hypothetical protein
MEVSAIHPLRTSTLLVDVPESGRAAYAHLQTFCSASMMLGCSLVCLS